MERKVMKKKGFTLVELLVVIAIIAMLLAILMPALGKVRQLAQRMVCGTNLSGIGKAMMVYTNDDEYESYPIAGLSGTTWDRGTGGIEGISTFEWRNPIFSDTASPKTSTIGACFYLLVKFADVSPDNFICGGSDQKKFELSLYDMGSYTTAAITDVWNFGERDNQKTTGSRAKGHYSYSYQLPFPLAANGNAFPITTTTNPARAVAADRNPFWTDVIGASSTSNLYVWDSSVTPNKVLADSLPYGNNTYHQKDGQNVLYADGHTKFEKAANCGIESDNIYTMWGKATLTLPTDEKIRQCGVNATTGTAGNTGYKPNYQTDAATTALSLNADDSYLVSDVDKAN